MQSSSSDTGSTILGFVLLFLFFGLPMIFSFLTFFLPSIVGLFRKKQDKLRIILINLFAGWFTPAWIYICVCAFLDNPSPDAK